MASSSVFGCNKQSSNLFKGGKLSKEKTAAPEPVILIADKNQVITAIIPFNTPMAASIRQHMHTTVLNDGQKIFIYRSVNGWTNIALDSSEAAPKLTCDPVTTLIKAWTEFNKCPQVSNITIKWKGSEQALSYDDIAGMEAEFVALPEGTGDADNHGESSKSDAEVLGDMVSALGDQMGNQMSTLSTNIDECHTQLTYLINLMETTRGEEASIAGPPPQTSRKSAGKRPAASR